MAEDVSCEGVVLVVAKVDLRDLDTRELRLVLVQVVDLLLADRRLHGDRSQRIHAALLHLTHQRPRGHLEDSRKPQYDLAPSLLGHVSDPQPNRGAGDVRDDGATLTIQDRPAGRLDANETKLVVLRRVQVLVAGEHLQRPQSQEEHREHDQRDPAEHADPQRQSRGEPVRLAHPGIGWEEALGGRAALVVATVRQGSRPPATARACRAPGRSPGRARTRAAPAGDSGEAWARAR